MKFSTPFSLANLIAAASLAMVAALPFAACAQDYRGMLNQQLRVADDLKLQVLKKPPPGDSDGWYHNRWYHPSAIPRGGAAAPAEQAGAR